MNDWNNISDDELDAILRKSAENFEPEFDESAWKDMSEKLDSGITPSGKGSIFANILRKASYGLLALLFISSVYWMAERNDRDAVKTVLPGVVNKTDDVGSLAGDNSIAQTDSSVLKGQSEHAVVSERERAGGAESGNLPEDKMKKENISPGVGSATSVTVIKNRDAELTIVAERSARVNKKVIADDPELDEKTVIRNNATEKVLPDSGPAATSGKTGKKAKVSSLQANEASSGEIQRKKKSVDPELSELSEIPEKTGNAGRQKPSEKVAYLSAESPKVEAGISAAGNNSEEILQKSILPDAGSLKLKDVRYAALLPEVIIPQPEFQNTVISFTDPVIPSPPRFGVRVIYSPDFTTISNNKIFRVGNNVGIMGEYRINNRWSIQTGVIRSLKYYGAKPEQYKTPYYVIKPGNPLKDISAICNMLDIPVNLRYDFNTNSYLNRWFVSAGITNYLMVKEKYNYRFEDDDDPTIKYRSWEGKTGFYPFGVLNLSGGYERMITRKISLQGEPFFKVPLKDVGYGKVKLVTIGIFISGKIGI